MTTLDAGTVLRSRLQSYRDTREHIRAPMDPQLKQDIIQYVDQRSKSGGSIEEATREIGLGASVYNHWAKRHSEEKKTKVKVSRVREYHPPAEIRENISRIKILVNHPTLGEIIIEGKKAMEVWNKISRLG